MKHKKNLYFLVPAVLFIWGVIIYRIVDFTAEGETDLTPSTYVMPLRERQESEHYQLKAWYPDPFLKQLTDNQIDTNEEEVTEVVPTSQEVAVPESPLDIQYRGFINESGTDARIALLVIAGKEVFLKSGEVYQVITIDRIRSDSLSIIYEGNVRWFKKVR